MKFLCFASSFVPVNPITRVQGFKCHQKLTLPSFSWKAVASKDSRTSEEILRLTQKLEELRAKREEVLSRQNKAAPNVSFEAPAMFPDLPNEPIDNVQSSIVPDGLEFGKHGEGSRFLSISTCGGEEFFPRVVPLLDDLSSLRPTDVTGCPALGVVGKPETGKLSFSHIPPGFSAQVIALPLTGALTGLVDPIAITVWPDLLADNLPVDGDAKAILVVERNLDDLEWDKYKFYVWGVGDQVRVGWLSDMPPSSEAECLGRVMCALLEEPAERRKAKSCWEEESELY